MTPCSIRITLENLFQKLSSSKPVQLIEYKCVGVQRQERVTFPSKGIFNMISHGKNYYRKKGRGERGCSGEVYFYWTNYMVERYFRQAFKYFVLKSMSEKSYNHAVGPIKVFSPQISFSCKFPEPSQLQHRPNTTKAISGIYS